MYIKQHLKKMKVILLLSTSSIYKCGTFHTCSFHDIAWLALKVTAKLVYRSKRHRLIASHIAESPCTKSQHPKQYRRGNRPFLALLPQLVIYYLHENLLGPSHLVVQS